MNSKDQLDMYIEKRLEDWAKWYGSDNHNLGYARRNILARIKDEGGLLNKATGHKLSLANLEAEETEKLYLYLLMQNKKRAEALRIRYHFPFDHEIKAVHNGYSRAQYYRNLKLEHEWLRGFFSARKNF